MHRYRHDPSKHLVGFVVGDVEYAIAIAQVKEIANPLTVVPLPHAPRSVLGVADYRGQVVSVVDMRTRFGLSPTRSSRKTKWIVIDAELPAGGDGSAVHSSSRPPIAPSVANARLVALVVDAVTDVFGTGGAELRPAPDLGGGDDVRGIAGVITHDGTLVFVLDTARLREFAVPLAAASGQGATGGQLSGDPSSTAAGRALPARRAP